MWTAPGQGALLVLVGFADVEHDACPAWRWPRPRRRCPPRGCWPWSTSADLGTMAYTRKPYQRVGIPRPWPWWPVDFQTVRAAAQDGPVVFPEAGASGAAGTDPGQRAGGPLRRGSARGGRSSCWRAPAETGSFWDAVSDAEWRAKPYWPGLLRAPVIIVPLTDEAAYRARYAEADKAAHGLGRIGVARSLLAGRHLLRHHAHPAVGGRRRARGAVLRPQPPRRRADGRARRAAGVPPDRCGGPGVARRRRTGLRPRWPGATAPPSRSSTGAAGSAVTASTGMSPGGSA